MGIWESTKSGNMGINQKWELENGNMGIWDEKVGMEQTKPIHVVPLLSTGKADSNLTSECWRDRVFHATYERIHQTGAQNGANQPCIFI